MNLRGNVQLRTIGGNTVKFEDSGGIVKIQLGQFIGIGGKLEGIWEIVRRQFRDT